MASATHRNGVVVARCTVERLTRAHGLWGTRRGNQFVTTHADPAANRAPDHVKRNFRAERPNELWVVDFTYVPTWSGMTFTAFVTDVFSRRIVGDSYDNALAETVVGLYKTECVKLDGPFRTANELELAALSWVHWFNENRLHSSIGYLSPVEKEDLYYRENNIQKQPLLGEPSLHQTRDDSG